MNKNPIYNIDIFLSNVLSYLRSIESDLKFINQDNPNLSTQIQSLFTKHSNNFIKNNNNKINAINELKTIVLLSKDQQKDIYNMFINTTFEKITTIHEEIELKLNNMHRFALNYLAIDYVQFLEFKTVWDKLNINEHSTKHNSTENAPQFQFHVVNGNKWNTADRYDLLSALGFISQLEDSGLTTDEKREILAIILKTTPEMARKTSYGTTKTQSNQTDQINYYKEKFKRSKMK